MNLPSCWFVHVIKCLEEGGSQKGLATNELQLYTFQTISPLFSYRLQKLYIHTDSVDMRCTKSLLFQCSCSHKISNCYSRWSHLLVTSCETEGTQFHRSHFTFASDNRNQVFTNHNQNQRFKLKGFFSYFSCFTTPQPLCDRIFADFMLLGT